MMGVLRGVIYLDVILVEVWLWWGVTFGGGGNGVLGAVVRLLGG